MVSKRSARPLRSPIDKAAAGEVIAALALHANTLRAEHSARFFKTGPGQYGYGDRFLGLSVGDQRRVARHFRALPHGELAKLLASPWHEHRLTALLILVDQYERGDPAAQSRCYDFYCAHLAGVNQWDLVDGTAPHIVGEHLRTRSRRPLYRWARSQNMWERRIAIVATYAFIKAGETADTFALAVELLDDKEDLLHKAVGWMLREVGKRVSEDDLRGFLAQHASHLPRTALRYSIERFSPSERARWLRYK